MKRTALIFLCFLVSCVALGQELTGIITNNNGEVLPYASVYVEETQSGATTNSQGYFEIGIPAGTYHVVFQYLGYETVRKTIDLGMQSVNINVVMKSHAVQLQDVEVRAGKEDPAYTIMRKAIAKAPFHLNELDRYTAQVYLKGSGRLLDVPFFVPRSKLEEFGIDSNNAFVSETVTNVEFLRPNTYKQHVISTRTSGGDGVPDPVGFIFASFYEPEIGGVVSPLSPKSFATYRFKYINSFVDNDQTINKIAVIPRSKGDNVVEGYIYLIEGSWSIYQLNLVTYFEGFRIEIKSVFQPIENKVWMPVSTNFYGEGSYLGFDLEFKYISNMQNYQIEINKDLDFEVEVVDEKIEKELAKQLKEIEKLDAQMDTSQPTADTTKGPSKKETKMTRKQLAKMLKEYEKEQVVEQPEQEYVAENYELVIDSMATKRDSAYWAGMRTVPLDTHEINGFKVLDSIAIAEKEKAKNDSVKANSFSPFELFFGTTIYKNDTSRLNAQIPVDFNTVDGFKVGGMLTYTRNLKDSNKWFSQIRGDYAIDRKVVMGKWLNHYTFGERLHRKRIQLEAGSYSQQFNVKEPVSNPINALMSLLFVENYMKLYQNNYIQGYYVHNTGPKFRFQVGAGVSQRSQLYNSTNFSVFTYHDRAYTANAPINQERAIDFLNHTAVNISGKVFFKPWQKIRVYNGRKQLIRHSSPTFWLGGHFTQNDTYTNSVLASVGGQHHIKVKGERRLKVNYEGGYFLSAPSTFVDYKHFMGNESPFTKTNPVDAYRMLPYYYYSTSSGYVNTFVNYEFRRLALTQLMFMRLTGVKECLFANYLYNDYNQLHYVELGYGLNNLFRIFKAEVVTNNLNDPFTNWALRIGIAF